VHATPAAAVSAAFMLMLLIFTALYYYILVCYAPLVKMLRRLFGCFCYKRR
jgi:hypothetical protein